MILITLSLCAFAWVLWPLFDAIFWAAVIAMVFSPLYERLLPSVRGSRNIAAGTTVVIILMIVIAPLMLIATALARVLSDKPK